MDGYEVVQVEVAGGPLTVGRRGRGERTVLALHGLAGSFVAMSALGREFDEDEFTVLAPDLRGRGASNELPGPYGLDVHVRDCVAVLDAFDVERAALTGHSMGGFLSVRLAAQHPGRAAGATLIDGGLPLDVTLPEGVTPDDMAHRLLGPILDTIARTFTTREEFLDSWREQPALGGVWTDELAARFLYELTGKPGAYRSRTSLDAVRADWLDALTSFDVAADALRAAVCPLVVYRSGRGLQNQPEPTLTDDLVARWTTEVPRLEVVTIEDTNHLTIGTQPHATAQIARTIRAAAGLER